MSATKYIARVTQITVLPEGKSMYYETATIVSIEDEGGGEFVTLQQDVDGHGESTLRIDPEEWPDIRKAVDEMIKNCQEERK